MPKLNRFEWLKAVLQCADLHSSTKAVASALCVQFANDKTGQLNPSLKTLDEFLAGMSLATIKRCLKQLVEFGWLFRTEGRGAGNHTEYDLRSPAKIIPFRRKKKSAPVGPLDARKGSSMTGKGLTDDLSYNKVEQSTEQSAPPSGRSTLRELCLPCPLAPPGKAVFVEDRSFSCRQWSDFSRQMLDTWMDRAFPEVFHGGKRGFLLPSEYPPTSKANWPELRNRLLSEGWTKLGAEIGEACYAR